MTTSAETISAIKQQTLTMIAELTANPKPSYSIDGQQVAWTEYLARLQATVDWCDTQLASSEPFEFQTKSAS